MRTLHIAVSIAGLPSCDELQRMLQGVAKELDVLHDPPECLARDLKAGASLELPLFDSNGHKVGKAEVRVSRFE